MIPKPKGTLKALVLDDNPTDCALIFRALRREFQDLDALQANDAEEFNRVLSGSRFDIVVTDSQLSWSPGLELLPIILAAQPGCPIIMFSGSGDEKVALEALSRGADDYIRKAPGQFSRLAAAVRGSTEKARLKRRADSLDRKLNDLLTGLDVGVYRVTTRGHLIYGNPAFYRILRFGMNPGHSAMRMHHLILNPHDQAWIFREMKRKGRVRIPELQLRHPDGTTVWVSMTQTYRPSWSKGGVIDGIVEDITEKKRMDAALLVKEAELREAQKLETIGKFAGGVAHDFNNMLSAILGYCELMLEADPGAPPERSSLQEIHRAAQKAAGLTRELLAFGRKQMLFPKIVEINAVLLEMEPLIRTSLGEGTELILTLGSAPARIKVDPVQLEIVIMNLVSNAKDAMPSGGRLTIKVGMSEGEVEGFAVPGFRDSNVPDRPGLAGRFACLMVSDTGAGMDSGIQSRIFEPYFTTKNDFHNSGLGLSSVYGIVNQSGGYIVVDSQPGRGAAFKLFFPEVPTESREWNDRALSDAERSFS